jgi:hypothetical protein
MKPSLKWRLSFIACVALLGCFVDCAHAKVHPKVLAANNQHVCSVSVDASGIPDIVYQGGDYRLHHAQLVRERWQLEIVDGISDCGWGNSIALDSRGGIHISYGALRDHGPMELVFSYFDGTHWQITDLGLLGSDTVLKLDPHDQPHIFFAGERSLLYARFDGWNWHIEDTHLDASDAPLPMLLKVRGLKPGSSAPVRVRFQYSGSLQGKHLIAVIDPEVVTFDRNLLDNMVAIRLGF